jgi:deoxyribonuclease-4
MIRFGVAGVPPAFNQSSFRKNRTDIIRWLAELGLEAFEIQMTYGPRTRPEICREYRALAEELKIRLSVHAAYYIVFTSDDEKKLAQSRDTMKRTFELADILGAKEIVLHPGPLYGADALSVLDRCIENLGAFMHTFGKTDIGLFVETAGKLGQLGSIDEIIALSEMIEGVHPCVDFGHVHARTLGSLEQPQNIVDIVDTIRKFVSVRPEKRLHFHYTPIHFGPRGEIQHRAISDRYPVTESPSLFGRLKAGEGSDDGFFHPRPEPVMSALQCLDCDFSIISETHDSQEEGALALQSSHRSLLAERPQKKIALG